jgi:hypothetical protein
MSTKPSRIRTVQRWVHIVFGLAVLCYIYSPFSQYAGFRFFVKWLAVPVLVISGLWLWKPQFLTRLLKTGR